MAVITLSREFGSEGNAIGVKIAEILKYRFVFKKDIDEIFLKYGMKSLDDLVSQISYWSRYDRMQTNTTDFLNKVIYALAKRGNIVIIGRCGFSVLQDFNDVLHIRIKAPLATKVERICQENITTEDKVEAYIKKQEKSRVELLEILYNIDWYNTQPFNMVLDTDKVRPDRVVAWVVEATRKLETRSIPMEYSTQSIKVDPLLDDIVSKVLA